MRDEDREDARQCDDIIKEALERIQAAGVPMHVMIDRLATYAAFASVVYAGKTHTAEQFHQIGNTVASGVFDDVTGSQIGRG
jgi:hypothetical protein